MARLNADSMKMKDPTVIRGSDDFTRSLAQVRHERETYYDGKNREEFPLYTEFSKKPTGNIAESMIKGIHQYNLLNNAFFSRENIQIIQNRLKFRVFEESKGKHRIGNQSEADLLIIMRYIYLQFSKNLPYDIPKQIKELNELVVDEVLPQVFASIDQHLQYLKDISRPYGNGLIDRPTYVSSAGTRTLRSVTDIFSMYDPNK